MCMANKSDNVYSVEGLIREDGLLELDHFKLYKKLFERVNLLGHRVIITVQKYRKKRSARQNRYIHGVVVPVVQYWLKNSQGESKTHDQVYMWLRIGVLGHKPEVSDIQGDQVIVMTGKRFSKQNTKEFAESVDTIVKIMDTKGCTIPLPRKENLLTDFLHTEDDIDAILTHLNIKDKLVRRQVINHFKNSKSVSMVEVIKYLDNE